MQFLLAPFVDENGWLLLDFRLYSSFLHTLEISILDIPSWDFHSSHKYLPQTARLVHISKIENSWPELSITSIDEDIPNKVIHIFLESPVEKFTFSSDNEQFPDPHIGLKRKLYYYLNISGDFHPKEGDYALATCNSHSLEFYKSIVSDVGLDFRRNVYPIIYRKDVIPRTPFIVEKNHSKFKDVIEIVLMENARLSNLTIIDKNLTITKLPLSIKFPIAPIPDLDEI